MGVIGGLWSGLQQKASRLWLVIPTPLRVRLLPLVLMIGSGTVLGLAAWLTPSPDGHATHLQLGLNSCTILTATGYPCPMCGATTTFALWAHFRPIAALLNQPFASLLFWMTVSGFSISVADLLQPRQRWERLSNAVAPYEMPLAAAFMIFMGISWIYKTILMS